MPRKKGDHTRVARRDDRQRAWQSMRVIIQYTGPQIEAVSQIKRDNLKRFIRPLVQGGFIRCVKKNISGRPGSFKIWRLIRNSGPKRPIPWKNGRVFDPNTNKIYGQNGEEIHD